MVGPGWDGLLSNKDAREKTSKGVSGTRVRTADPFTTTPSAVTTWPGYRCGIKCKYYYGISGVTKGGYYYCFTVDAKTKDHWDYCSYYDKNGDNDNDNPGFNWRKSARSPRLILDVAPQDNEE